MVSLIFLTAFGLLALLGLTQLLRGKGNLPYIGAAFFWLALLTLVIAVLSVGLLQSHLGCLSLWGECYAHNYPLWLWNLKPLIMWSPVLWCVFALIASATNIVVFLRSRRPK